ncbi:putative orfan [Tupanvirus soda lake]|uniref:Orfan n=2 Tax=Tupanvirus TaxID=2094720 RepID=A0AC62ABW2_9VIRU|nr:putative orfan [Tupanvirus soda lake]QKU35130.1 putative orfan [Tupanvirus soda lake]
MNGNGFSTFSILSGLLRLFSLKTVHVDRDLLDIEQGLDSDTDPVWDYQDSIEELPFGDHFDHMERGMTHPGHTL